MEQKIIAAGALAICPETNRFLMLKRRDDVVYPGYWGIVGGNFEEKDVYPKKTAIRELREETGYDGPIKVSKQPIYVEKTNHIDFYTYICILPWEFVPNLKGECKCGKENLDFGWFPLTCKWDYEENIIPSIIEILDIKRESIEKVVNKFKNKNYE